jgi:hypothetical protein
MNEFISDMNFVGFAGEHLVRKDLMMKRIITNTPDMPWTPYDMIAFINGNLLMIQVKTKFESENDKLRIDVRKSNGKERKYSLKECHIIAIPDTITGKVAYLPPSVWLGVSNVTMWKYPPRSMNGFGKGKQPLMFDDFLEFPSFEEIVKVVR